MLTSARAVAVNATQARKYVVLGDGTMQASRLSSEVVTILDWPHLWRTIHEAVCSLSPGTCAVHRARRRFSYMCCGRARHAIPFLGMSRT